MGVQRPPITAISSAMEAAQVVNGSGDVLKTDTTLTICLIHVS